MPGEEKLLVIGLDGAGYPFLRQLLEAGRLPTLQGLIARGSIGGLDSTEIILTPVAWSTSYTGKNPAKHGICGFTRRRRNTYLWQYVSPANRASKEYWRVLDDQGYTSILVGPIFCQKQEEFGGIFVGGEYCGEIERSVHPESLKELVIDHFNYQPVSPCRNLEEVEVFLRRKFELAAHLLQHNPWRLGFVGFMEPDLLHHSNDPDFARQGYEVLDRLLGEFLKGLPADLSVLIYSDHGHRTFERAFHVNSWLKANGFLAEKPWWAVWRKRMAEAMDGVRQINGKLDSLGEKVFYSSLFLARNLVRSLPLLHKVFVRFFPGAGLPDKARPVVFGEQFEAGAQLQDLEPGALFDYGRTLAYAYLNRGGNIAGICINAQANHPQGCVTGEDYHRIREQLIERLGQVRTPRTGEPLVKKVWRREEVFSGEYLEDFPDLLFEIDEEYFTYISEDNLSGRNIFLELKDSQHAREGVLICSGPAFSSAERPSANPGLVDIAPTILYALGARIPEDLDGRVLDELFAPEFRIANPVTWTGDTTKVEAGAGYTLQEERALEERLRGLGYIE